MVVVVRGEEDDDDDTNHAPKANPVERATAATVPRVQSAMCRSFTVSLNVQEAGLPGYENSSKIFSGKKKLFLSTPTQLAVLRLPTYTPFQLHPSTHHV